jgi:hypothetical protein
MKGHALGRFLADTRQAAQSLNQRMEDGLGHSGAAGLKGKFHAGRQGHAGGDFAHFVLRDIFGAADGVVEGGRDQVFEHVFVFGEQTGVNADALDVVFAGHGNFDQASARLALDFDVGQFVLGFFEVVLHGLGLFHETRQLVFHHGVARFL